MMPLPPVIAGTSALGNLYEALPLKQKIQIVEAYIEAAGRPAVFDSAGKYGAGLALETLGLCLKELGVPPDDVLISNKLGWSRMPLLTPEPTFEPGVWKDLQYDAAQKISYSGIMECFEQGNALLGDYPAQMVSVHDPDEYLFAAQDEWEEATRYEDVLAAYRALNDLKKQGRIASVGIGSKDWKTIRRISQDVALDWVMLANSLTIYSQPPALLDFVRELDAKGIAVINSAVFHGGFLAGSNFFNYQPVSRDNGAHQSLYLWRDQFYALCQQFGITPAAACICFARKIPGVKSIALNSTSPDRTRQNVIMAGAELPPSFWLAMKDRGLISSDYAYV